MTSQYANPDLGPDMAPGYRRPGRYVRPDPSLPNASTVELPPEPPSAPPAPRPTPTRAAQRLRAWRIYTGTTQLKMAARLGVSQATIYRMETGAKPVPDDIFAQLDAWYREPRRWQR